MDYGKSLSDVTPDEWKRLAITLIVGTVIGVAVLMVLLRGCSAAGERVAEAEQRDGQRIEAHLSAFRDLDEVQWMAFDGRDVYVGFDPRPHDVQQMMRSWAAQASREVDARVSLWAVPAEYGRSWRPDNDAHGTVYAMETFNARWDD